MRSFALALAISLAAFSFVVPSAPAIGCVVGDDPGECTVSIQWVVCVTDPCDGLIICVGHGQVCSNRLLP